MLRKIKRFQSARDRVLCLLVLIMVFPCLGLGLLGRGHQIESLAGVQGLQVGINIGLSIEGPTKQGLQEQIEKQLREAGLQVLAPVEADSESYQPSLLIEAAIWKSGKKPYIYFIYANFYQPVKLVGGDSSDTLGATWQSGLMGKGDLDRIRKDVAKIVKLFLKHHKRANEEKLQAAID